MILVFNIFTDDVSRDFVTYTPDKISIVPKFSSPKLFPKLRKFFEHFACRYALHNLHYLCRRISRRRLAKYVHVVFNHLHRVYVKTVLLSNFLKDLFQIFLYFFDQYVLPVLRYPYQVIFQVVDGMFSPMYAHADYIAGLPMFSNLNSSSTWGPAFIPPASWRVFSRRFL